VAEARVTAAWGRASSADWAVLVHGGAGDARPEDITAHVAGCRAAADAARAVLAVGGPALDAVEAAVVSLENDPLFNAGRGAALNADGEVELDASIMDGRTLRAGAVCALPPFANPIAIARAVLEDGRHVLYAGEGAARFAVGRGFARTTSEALTTRLSLARLEAARAKPSSRPRGGGTVGAVALDRSGNVAAATSTGGRTNKRPGRVGDSPILGAGTYADHLAGAASATGDGEAVIRVCLTKTAIDRMRSGMTPEEAARVCIDLLASRGQGTGGVILVDTTGRLGFARSTAGMTWAAAAADGFDDAGS
jgi:L-asparaginase / beta-aspartyl-peptidase